MSKIKLALLSGGTSPEREISLKSGARIFDALDKNKYEIFQYDPKNDLAKFFIDATTKKFDLVIPALHGAFGEDGKLQGMLDLIGMPYLFSGVFASSAAINKHIAKIIAKDLNINVPKDFLIRKNSKFNTKDIIMRINFPMIIKPATLGSSVGIILVHKKEELENAIANVFVNDDLVLIEEYIKGREFTVGISGNKTPEAMPVIEIIPNNSAWFDYKAKYEDGGAQEICPAVIPDDLKSELQKTAIKIYGALDCKDLARADFIVSESNAVYFLEINTIPGMTETSLIPKAVGAQGYQFGVFLDSLINGALEFYKIKIEE